MTVVSSRMVARAILLEALPGVKVVTRVPNPRPSRFIRLDRVGGSKDRSIDRVRVLVECFNSDDLQAEQDCLTAYEALRLSPNGGPFAGAWIAGWEGNSIAHYDDPDITNQSRWQFTGVLRII